MELEDLWKYVEQLEEQLCKEGSWWVTMVMEPQSDGRWNINGIGKQHDGPSI